MLETAHHRILIAEDNDVSRDLMAKLLKSEGFEISTAIDGGSAIKVVQEQKISLALVDLHMQPKGGFEFVKYILSEKMDIPVVLITADQSSDLLVQANKLGVSRLLQKPVDPAALKKIVTRTIEKKYGVSYSLSYDAISPYLSKDELMSRAIDLADLNIKEGSGGPFAAVVADESGAILGEGTTSKDVTCDPVGHAEISAIKEACQKLNTCSLETAVLFTVVEPSFLARAVIYETGVSKVYYALSREQMGLGDDDMSDAIKGGAENLSQYEMFGTESAFVFLDR